MGFLGKVFCQIVLNNKVYLFSETTKNMFSNLIPYEIITYDENPS